MATRGQRADGSDRGETIRRRTVAELAAVVPTPAACGRVGEEGARVEFPASGDRGHAREPRDRNWGEPSCRRRPLAEFAEAVITPAADGAGREKSASVEHASGDRGHAREPRDGNWGQLEQRRCPVAELAGLVVTPAAFSRVD